ncbi:MAG: hypothetical protein Q4E69_01965 [Bacilli bacterium]|nr:hypothetical protein [Bacilli bacterium]
MKKYLVGIVLFIMGISLMIVGFIMQLSYSQSVHVGETDKEEVVDTDDDNTTSELLDTSTFSFDEATSTILSGSAQGYVIACSDNIKTPTPVNLISMNGLLEKIKTAKGYRVSNKSFSTCPLNSFVIGTLESSEVTGKILEVEIYDNNTLLISNSESTYEFIYEEDISSLFTSLS